MKKIIVFILTAVMCLSLVACGGVIGKDLEGNVCIKYNQFGSLIEKVELTAENWSEYISVYSYDKVVVERDDATNEIISQTTVTKYCLGANTERYHSFGQMAAIELEHKQTDERQTFYLGYGGHSFSEADFSLDDYNLISITGALYFIDLPEEVITEYEPGRGVFYIGNSSFNLMQVVDLSTKAVEMMDYQLDEFLD